MECYLKIGDSILQITPIVPQLGAIPPDTLAANEMAGDQHLVTALDVWNLRHDKPGGHKSIVVESESKAGEILAAFLNPDGPLPAFEENFPEFCP